MAISAANPSTVPSAPTSARRGIEVGAQGTAIDIAQVASIHRDRCDHRQQNRLYRELPYQVQAPRPDGNSNGELGSPPVGSNQHE